MSNPPAPSTTTSISSGSSGSSGSSAVRVMARFRPLNRREKDRGSDTCVQFQSNSATVVKHVSDTGANPYTFDHVFPPGTTQHDIYRTAAAPITQAVLQGYNGTIFAYVMLPENINNNTVNLTYIIYYMY